MKRLSSVASRWMIPAILLVGCALIAATPLPAQAPAAPQSPPEALVIFNDAVNFQNNGAFDLAADEYRKFLKRFPKDPLALRTRYYLGVCLTQLGDLAKATVEFAAVLEGDKTFASREDAYLNLATCQYSLAQGGQAEMFEQAAATFGGLAKEFPQGKHAAESLYFQGEALYAADKKPAAVKAYDQVIADFPDSKRRAEALYASGATQEELGNFPEAGQTYDIFLKEFPDHPKYATEVRMRKAETLLQAGKLAPAEKLFAETAAVEGFALADHAAFRQGECAFKQEKFGEAGTVFAGVATNFPQSASAADAMMRAGQAYYRAQKYDDAKAWFDKVIAAAGKDAVEAAHWRCRIHLRQGESARAAELATATLPQAADNPFLVDLIMDQADGLYEDRDRRAESLPLYVKIYSEHPDHEQAPQALYNAAYTALDLTSYDDALKHANEFLAKYPDHTLLLDAKYVAAESLLQLGQLAESEKLYRELTAAAKDRPELAAWQLRLGVVLYLQKKRQEVVDTLTPLLSSFELADQKAEAQFLVGTCHYFLDQYDAAVQALEASLAANPNWAQADETRLNLSMAQRKLNQLDAAITNVKRVLKDFPQSKLLDRAHFRLGEYSYASGDYATAMAQYDQVVEGWPDSVLVPYALSGAGWARLKSKAYADAVTSFTSLIDQHPDHALVPAAQNARATCRYQTKDYAGGIADVNAYLASKPGPEETADALFVRGLCEVAAKNYADAVKTFESILADKPDYNNAARVLYEWGWALKSDGKEDESVAVFTRLTTEHPDHPLAAEAFYHVGEAQYAAEEYAKAAQSYLASRDKATQGDLGEKAGYKLGWANYQLKQYAEALAAFADQVTKSPEGKLYADGLFMQAESQFKLEKYDEALPTFEKCLTLSGYSNDIQVLILLHAGQSASQTKAWKKAIELLEKITTNFPDSQYVAEATYEQGWAQQNLGQADAAKKLYAAAAEKSRSEVGARARFMLGELYFTEKDYGAAIDEFRRAVFGYGGDQAPPGVKKWQSKSAYEVGRCNDVQIAGAKTPAQRQEFVKDAIRFYGIAAEKVPDGPEAPLATQRVKALEALAP